MQSYDRQWRALRTRYWVGLAVLLIGMPVTVAIELGADYLFSGRHEELTLIVPGLIWAGTLLWAGLRIARFPCPRCGHRLFAHDSVQLFTHHRECISCGQRIYGRVEA